MLGQPDPVPFLVRGLASDRDRNRSEFQRDGFVSIWVGNFTSIEEAEAYFGIPEKVGLYLPAEAFVSDFGLGDFPPETLEANFEQLSPRPLAELLRDATFADSFRDRAVEAARRQGIHEAQGVALLYDFDYRLKPDRRDAAGPVRFVAAVPFVGVPPGLTLKALEALQEVARELGCPFDAVVFVFGTLRELSRKRKRERPGEAVQISARDYCQYLVGCRGEETAPLLRDLGLQRSEEVGRIMFGLVTAGLARRHETDQESDFAGLFDLGEG